MRVRNGFRLGELTFERYTKVAAKENPVRCVDASEDVDRFHKQRGPVVLRLFAFGFVARVMRATSGRAPKATPGQVEVEDGEPFDADAALARYMAKKAAGELDTPVAPVPTPNAPPSRGGFGRKTV